MVWASLDDLVQAWLVADEVAWANRCFGAGVAVLVLVVTAPIREVVFGACCAVFKWVGDGLWLGRSTVERFLMLVRRVDAKDYRGLDYGWAVLECVFVAPMAVLQEQKNYYGLFGRTCILWCRAWQHSVCDYLPDSSMRKWVAVKEVGVNSVSATAASWKRWCDFVMMIYSLVRVVLAFVVYGPLLAYRALEFCLHGCVGVAVVLSVIGGVDYFCEWHVCFVPITIVVFVGVCSYIELAYQALGEPVKIAPRPVAEACWRDWRRRDADRLAREERLRRRVFASTVEESTTPDLEDVGQSGEIAKQTAQEVEISSEVQG